MNRPIRSYVLRQGRTTPAQQRALDELFPRFGLPFAASPIDTREIFGREAPLVLEIGFGMGESSAAIAQANPQNDYLGIEVHTPGVGSLLKRIEAASLSNLRIIQHDAAEVVRNMIPPASLAGVHIFFPDPWPKKRHHKRRLIQPQFVSLLCERMKPGAYLHATTDWEEYAQQILEVLSTELRLANTTDRFAIRPEYRTLTKFEQRGLKLGHPVWDIVFRKP